MTRADIDDDEDTLMCCDHRDILPEVVHETGITSCTEKEGFSCISQDVSYMLNIF